MPYAKEPQADTKDSGHKEDRQQQGGGSNIGSAPTEADSFTQPTSSSEVPGQGTATGELLESVAEEPVAEEQEGFRVRLWQLMEGNSRKSCPLHGELEETWNFVWICDCCREPIGRGQSCRCCNLDFCDACIEMAERLSRSDFARLWLLSIMSFSLQCRSKGRPADAEAALKAWVKQLREQHAESPELAIALRELGTVLKEKGELVAAEQNIKKALGMVYRVFGESPNHEVAATLHELGLVLKKKGDMREAERLLTEALVMKRAIFGKAPNRSVAVTLHELALLFKEKGELVAAEQHLTKALDMERAVFGEAPNREVALTLHRLGLVFKKMGELRQAERLLTEALVMKRAIFGKAPTWEVAATLHDLGLVFKEKGELREAERLVMEALDMEHECPEFAKREMAVTVHELALLFKEKGELPEAKQHIREASDIERAFFGEAPNRSHELGWTLTEKGTLLAAKLQLSKDL